MQMLTHVGAAYSAGCGVSREAEQPQANNGGAASYEHCAYHECQ